MGSAARAAGAARPASRRPSSLERAAAASCAAGSGRRCDCDRVLLPPEGPRTRPGVHVCFPHALRRGSRACARRAGRLLRHRCRLLDRVSHPVSRHGRRPVAMWLSPWDNFVRPGGDHLAQSFWTFAAGAVFGTGLGMGEHQSVPAIHTDLVLAAIAEELGFAGLLAVFVVFALLIHRAMMILFLDSCHYT